MSGKLFPRPDAVFAGEVGTLVTDKPDAGFESPVEARGRQGQTARILSAMVTVGALSVLVKMVATGKEFVVAQRFGTSGLLDAFLIAFLLPSFAINVIAQSIGPALIPTFVEVRERHGQQAANKLLSAVMGWGTVLLVVVSFVLAVTYSRLLPLLGSGFSPEQLRLTRMLFFILLPALMVSGMASTAGAVLNAGRRFGLAAVAPILTPLATLGLLFALRGDLGVYALAAGTSVGAVLGTAVLCWSLHSRGFSLKMSWGRPDPALKSVINQYLPAVAGAFLMCSTGLVDQSMAAMLPAGSVSALSYGNKVVAVIMEVGPLAMSTVLLPYFSSIAAVEDWRSMRDALNKYGRLIVAVTVPTTLLLVYFSGSLVRLLFQRGAFTTGDTQIVGSVQALLALQIPFHMVGMMFVRLISSLKANRVLMYGAALSGMTNIALNYVLMKWLGVAGIALSTSLVYVLSCAYLMFMSGRLMRKRYALERQR